jgi:hypothetical protein
MFTKKLILNEMQRGMQQENLLKILKMAHIINQQIQLLNKLINRIIIFSVIAFINCGCLSNNSDYKKQVPFNEIPRYNKYEYCDSLDLTYLKILNGDTNQIELTPYYNLINKLYNSEICVIDTLPYFNQFFGEKEPLDNTTRISDCEGICPFESYVYYLYGLNNEGFMADREFNELMAFYFIPDRTNIISKAEVILSNTRVWKRDTIFREKHLDTLFNIKEKYPKWKRINSIIADYYLVVNDTNNYLEYSRICISNNILRERHLRGLIKYYSNQNNYDSLSKYIQIFKNYYPNRGSTFIAYYYLDNEMYQKLKRECNICINSGNINDSTFARTIISQYYFKIRDLNNLQNEINLFENNNINSSFFDELKMYEYGLYFKLQLSIYLIQEDSRSFKKFAKTGGGYMPYQFNPKDKSKWKDLVSEIYYFTYDKLPTKDEIKDFL